MEILICGDCAVATPFKMLSNNIHSHSHWAERKLSGREGECAHRAEEHIMQTTRKEGAGGCG